MRRALLALALLVLGTAAAAPAQPSVTVYSKTTIAQGQQAMAECDTTMDDDETYYWYPNVAADCTFLHQGQTVATFGCEDGIEANCRRFFPTVPGDTYSTTGVHWIGMDPYDVPDDPFVCEVAYDIFSYCAIGGIPSYPNTQTIEGVFGDRCLGVTSCVIATTYGDDTTTFFLIPSSTTLGPGEQFTFGAIDQVPLCTLISGPGHVTPGTCTYVAPASISGTQTAVVQGCNIFGVADCANSIVTLQNSSVTVAPGDVEVLPGQSQTFTATLTPSNPSQTFTWSVTPAGYGTIDSATGVFLATPNNDALPGPVTLTVKGCKANTTVCGTATLHVPKVLVTIVGGNTLLATVGASETLSANVVGPSTSEEVDWNPTTLPKIGFNTTQYTVQAPAPTSAQTVPIKACLHRNINICGTLDLQLIPPAVILSAGTWNAGQTSLVVISGTGFGNSPVVRVSDPSIALSVVAASSNTINLNATVPVAAGGHPLTVTVDSGGAGGAASASVTVTSATFTISPTSASLRESQQQPFTAACRAPNGSACTGATLSWIPSVGTVDGSGLYTAPASVATTTTGTVKACWSPFPEHCATAAVTITPLTVTLSPTSANVNGCTTKPFTAQVTNAAVTTVTWSLSPATGSLDSTGLYTAPCPVTAPATVQVKACSTVNSLKCATAPVTLVPISVAVSPSSASLLAGGSQQFASVVQGTTNLAVAWTITPPTGAGKIDATSGLYSAPNQIGSVTSVLVTATSKADNTTYGTATVTLSTQRITVTPGSLTFAAQNTGTTSAAQTVTVANTGTAAVSLSGLSATGDFLLVNNTCGASLSPGASCTAGVQFRPTAGGTRTGALQVADSAPGSPQTATLTGTGLGPAVVFTPSSLDFGGQRAGFATAPRTITLTNSGSGPLTITSVSVDSGEFPIQGNTCPSSLAAGVSCVITLSFSPAASSAGLRTGTLTVVDSAGGSPHTAGLQGSVFGGYHDTAACSNIAGWVWNSAQPNTPINVYLFEGSNLLATVLANLYRADLAGAGIGNGNHGFVWPTPASLQDGLSHTLTLRFTPDVTSVPIPGSPKSFTCPVATTSYNGYHDTATCQGLSGWGWDSNQPSAPVTLYIFQGTQLLDSTYANLFRQDLLDAGIGNGNHAFVWPIPSSLVDGQPHSLTVRFGSSSTSQALNGSPRSITCSPAPASATIVWIQKAESSWGQAGTLTAAGYAANGTGGVQLVWRERNDAGVWGSWTTVGYLAPTLADTSWSNTISSGSPTNACHWFDAYVVYSGVTSATYHYTGAPGCP